MAKSQKAKAAEAKKKAEEAATEEAATEEAATEEAATEEAATEEAATEEAATEEAASSHKVKASEKHLYHVELDKAQYDSKTGKKLTKAFVSKMQPKAFTQFKANAKQLGYTYKVLHAPKN